MEGNESMDKGQSLGMFLRQEHMVTLFNGAPSSDCDSVEHPLLLDKVSAHRHQGSGFASPAPV